MPAQRRFTDRDLEMFRLYQDGATPQALSRRYQISAQAVYQMVVAVAAHSSEALRPRQVQRGRPQGLHGQASVPQELLDQYPEQLSDEQIAVQIGRSLTTTRRLLTAAGKPSRNSIRRQRQAQRRQLAVDLIRAGKSYQEAAATMGVSSGRVRQLVPRRPKENRDHGSTPGSHRPGAADNQGGHACPGTPGAAGQDTLVLPHLR